MEYPLRARVRHAARYTALKPGDVIWVRSRQGGKGYESSDKRYPGDGLFWLPSELEFLPPEASSPRPVEQSETEPPNDLRKVAEGILAEMDRFGDKVLSGTASDDQIGAMAPVIVGMWGDKLRAALAKVEG
jgi:hypothetical protein